MFYQNSLESPLVQQVTSDILGGVDAVTFMEQLEGLVALNLQGKTIILLVMS